MTPTAQTRLYVRSLPPCLVRHALTTPNSQDHPIAATLQNNPRVKQCPFCWSQVSLRHLAQHLHHQHDFHPIAPEALSSQPCEIESHLQEWKEHPQGNWKPYRSPQNPKNFLARRLIIEKLAIEFFRKLLDEHLGPLLRELVREEGWAVPPKQFLSYRFNRRFALARYEHSSRMRHPVWIAPGKYLRPWEGKVENVTIQSREALFADIMRHRVWLVGVEGETAAWNFLTEVEWCLEELERLSGKGWWEQWVQSGREEVMAGVERDGEREELWVDVC